MFKIGVSTKCAPHSGWWDFLREKGFFTVELNRVFSKSYFSDKIIGKIRKGCKGLDLSVHSCVAGVFLCKGLMADAEFAMLKGEIVFCKAIGAKELVFHVEKKRLVSGDFRKLRFLVSLARKNRVQLLLENLSDFDLVFMKRVLDGVPGLLMNLDIGHLNRQLFNGSIKSFEEFIIPLRDKIVYVHLHNNYGRKDDHAGLDKGNLDYRKVLSLLDLRRVKKLVLEIYGIRSVLRSKLLLEKALKDIKRKSL